MFNFLCCHKDNDITTESMLDCGPKRRHALSQKKMNGQDHESQKARRPIKHIPIKIERSRQPCDDVRSVLSSINCSETSRSQSTQSDTQIREEKQNLLQQLHDKNMFLKRLFAQQLLPLEDQFVRLEVENRRKDRQIKILDGVLRRVDLAEYRQGFY